MQSVSSFNLRRLPVELKAILKAQAQRRGESLEGYIISLLAESVKKSTKKEKN